jgi:hypothetical protein
LWSIGAGAKGVHALLRMRARRKIHAASLRLTAAREEALKLEHSVNPNITVCNKEA